MTTHSSFAALVVFGLALSGAASGQVRTWNFGDKTSPGSCGPVGTPAYGNTVQCSEQPEGTVNTLAVNAFSGTTSPGTTDTAAGRTFATAALNYQGTGSGFGVYNQREGLEASSPDHSMDNGGSIDMMLLSFTTAQVLKDVTLGWSGADGDFQVLAYTGASAFSTASIIGKNTAGLIGSGNGWSLVSTVDGAGGISSPDIQYGVNAGNVSSSYWLITAFNSGLGGSGATSGADQIKVLSVSSNNGGGNNSGGVPEPTSLALAGVALAGLIGVRRRKAKSA